MALNIKLERAAEFFLLKLQSGCFVYIFFLLQNIFIFSILAIKHVETLKLNNLHSECKGERE